MPVGVQSAGGPVVQFPDPPVSITAGFSASGASVLDSVFGTPVVGTGVTYNQANGSLNILTGTTANAEFLATSVASFRGPVRSRFTLTASQRIANQNLVVMLADLIAAGAAYTIVSPTQVNVAVPGHGFDATNVGQFVNLGGITGAAGIPGRYAIAAIVDANTIQFTVAGWPASGSGTLTVFGRNYVRTIATGTTATVLGFDAQRNGWNTGDTSPTVNTTASPGVMVQMEHRGRQVYFADALRATTPTPNITTRASRYENIPDLSVDLRMFIWSYNGTAAPASTTTWTLGHLSVETLPNTAIPVVFDPMGTANPAPMAVQGTVPTSLATLPAIAGQAAHAAAIAGNPVRLGGRALNANYAAVATGQTADLISTLVGALITRPYAIPEQQWSFTGLLTTTTPVAARAAQAAGIRNYLSAAQLSNEGASAASVIVLDGATEIHRLTLAAGQTVPFDIPEPLRGSAATALNLNLAAAGTVRVNVQGHSAP